MAQGLGALTEGFQSGYKFSRDNARNKLIDKALDYEIAERGEGQKSREAAYKRFGKDYASGHDFQPQTWGSRFKGWLGSKMGMGQKQQAISANPMQMQAPATPSYDQMAGQDPGSVDGGMSGGIDPYSSAMGPPKIKHGGAIRHYADGGSALTIEEQLARKASAEQQLGRDLTPEQRREIARRQEARTARSTPAASNASVKPRPGRVATGVAGAAALPAAMYGAEQIGKAAGAAVTGGDYTDDEIGMTSTASHRDRLGMQSVNENEALRTGGDLVARAIGTAEEVGNAITFGYAGKAGDWLSDKIAGVDPEQEAAVRALDTEESPESVAAQPTGGGGAAGAGQVSVGASAPAVGADQTGVEDDEIIDFSQVRDVNPNDMPSKGRVEWEDERNFYAAQAVANGRDPLEALKQVDAKQMRGFTMYGQQAVALMQAGDATGAANALYAAYQYFPNGADVKFGVHKGKDGRPVLIGMATDEETGKPIKEGKPMVITSESLSVMVENFAQPGALRAWTKDWQKAEQDAREYAEITKPTAQSMATYRAKAGDAALMNAQSRLQEAVTAAKGGGLRQSDFDRAFNAMNEDADLMALFETVPPDEADYLKSVMAVAYKNSPGNFPRTSQIIKQAYRDGGIEAVDEMVSGGGSGP